jgi:hypothetical protein
MPWLTSIMSKMDSHEGVLDLLQLYVGYCRFSFHMNKYQLNMQVKNTHCAWAGAIESQFVVERKFIHELHNTSSKFDIRVKILEVIYVLICTMFSSLVIRVLLYKLFYELIFFES